MTAALLAVAITFLNCALIVCIDLKPLVHLNSVEAHACDELPKKIDHNLNDFLVSEHS